MNASTGVQWSAKKAVAMLIRMARQPKVKGPTLQRNVTLPVHLWEFVDAVAELQTEAYKEMGGRSKYFPSDMIEAGIEMYGAALVEEFGPLPTNAEERKSFVKRLAASNRKSLLEQTFGKKQ